MKKKKLTTKQLEIVMAIFFSIIILGLSVTDIAYIEIGKGRYIDIAVIPAIFAFMIGGPIIGVPVAVAWAFIVSTHLPTAPMYGLAGIMMIKVFFALASWYVYQIAKKINPGSPNNVYYAIIGAEVVRWTVSTFSISFNTHTSRFLSSTTYIGFLLETSLCLIAMFMLVEKLRQVHILNGIRRKERRDRKRKA